MGDITAATAAMLLSIDTLFNTPQQIQGFSADDIYDYEAIEKIQTVMGVDGVLSAGYVFKEQPMTITLQVDSASNNIFDVWQRQQDAALRTYVANMTVLLPAIGLKFIHTQGYLKRYKLPGAKQVLQPRPYGITWKSVVPMPIGA